MRTTIDVPVVEDGLWLSSDIVYGQTVHKGRGWHGNVRQLHLDLIRPVDESKRQPCIVFLSGGGWRHEEYHAYVPQMTWLAKRGYTLAFLEYTCNELRFPAQLQELKLAIRYLRAHADAYQIDPERFAVMGGSAGAHLAAMVAVTGADRTNDVGEYLSESSAVQACCTWYLPSDLFNDDDPEAEYTQKLLLGYPIHSRPEEGRKACPALLVDEHTPPFLLLHGTADRRVNCAQSEEMYQALEKAGIPADLFLIRGAGHGAPEFLQPQVNEIIGAFFDKYLKNK